MESQLTALERKIDDLLASVDDGSKEGEKASGESAGSSNQEAKAMANQ